MDRRADGDRPLASVGTPSRPLSVGWSATSPDDARSLAASHVSADTEALLAQQADMFSVRTLLQPSARQRSAATTRRPREAAPGRARSLLQAAGPRGEAGRGRESAFSRQRQQRLKPRPCQPPASGSPSVLRVVPSARGVRTKGHCEPRTAITAPGTASPSCGVRLRWDPSAAAAQSRHAAMATAGARVANASHAIQAVI